MTLDATEKQQRLDFAVRIAREAGELVLGFYRCADLLVERKADRSPVTEADRAAEKLLRERITAEYPDDGILGEELGEKESANGLRWILDPIDGTKAFVHGVGQFGTLIGLEERGIGLEERGIGLEQGDDVVIGVCGFPALGEILYAADGLGAWWQIGEAEPQRAAVSHVDRLDESLFCFTEIKGFYEIGRFNAFEALCDSTRIARGWGDCYGHMLVASGRAEVMVDPLLNPWDAAALLPIVREAGGHFLDWTGQETIHAGNGISVNAALKDAVLEILKA